MFSTKKKLVSLIKSLNLIRMKKIFFGLLVSLSITGFSQGIKYTKNDTIKYIVKNEIPRFFAGTFWTGVEFPLAQI